ncbi:Protein RTF2 [Schistosoma japonicum]|uniref:Replication termination factor 2 n=1 Tax=Schistosoma japonicum TaxID=6182 RepID=C1L4H3_SCHJA|nr:Replication termination factor 2 [Schistosoma japonicum]TNN17189.1 Protein RTF2 [Schistosoma japonicum]CAX69601.1 hypotheticial protein [Schistosoma japonicum]
MGGDGGSIPRRDDLVKPKKKQEVAEREAANMALWKHCALTQDPLRQPVVSCMMGRLYNKESVINKLLSKTGGDGFSDHIKKLRDVKELRLSSTSSSDNLEPQSFYCPVTGLEMSGIYPFVYLWSCGCVFSKKALTEVSSNLCMLCATSFSPDDIILINPQTKEEIETAKLRLTNFQSTSKTRKRSSANRISEQVDLIDESNIPAKKADIQDKTVESKKKLETSSEHEKAMTEQQLQPETPCTSRSIQEDPNLSSAYKSLFNTCEQAKRQPKSHWVTFNPLYFR